MIACGNDERVVLQRKTGGGFERKKKCRFLGFFACFFGREIDGKIDCSDGCRCGARGCFGIGSSEKVAVGRGAEALRIEKGQRKKSRFFGVRFFADGIFCGG